MKSNAVLGIEAASQRYYSYFGMGMGLFFLATVVSAREVMGIISIYICTAVAVYLFSYSLITLRLARNNITSPFLKYFGTLSLFVALTVAKYSFVYGRIGYADVLKETMTFDLYFILVMFTAVYNDRRLSLLSGFFAAFMYGCLLAVGALAYGMELTVAPEANINANQIRINIEIIKCLLLVGAGFLMNFITGNLNRLLEKVSASESDAHRQARIPDEGDRRRLRKVRRTAEGVGEADRPRALLQRELHAPDRLRENPFRVHPGPVQARRRRVGTYIEAGGND